MMYQDLHMHGGVIGEVKVLGDLHMHGGVITNLEVNGKCQQHGGIILRKNTTTGEAAIIQQHTDQPRVVYREKIVYRDSEKLIRKCDALRAENNRLREDLEKKEISKPCDDVLVQRIKALEKQLEKERDAHRKKIDDLQYNLNGVKDAYFELLHKHRETESRSQEIADKHIDILATLMSLYPFTPDNDLVFEFGIPAHRIKDVARVLGGIKSKEARLEAREYLRKQGLNLIERRGGDQTKGKREQKRKH